MGFFTTRERPDIAKLADVTGEIREFVHQQKDSNADGQPPANNLASLLQTPEREIDNLIAELQALRDKLQSEGARVQQKVVDYATLSQSAMQSTKVISEFVRNSWPARSSDVTRARRLDEARAYACIGMLNPVPCRLPESNAPGL
jgi:hypothetical protein